MNKSSREKTKKLKILNLCIDNKKCCGILKIQKLKTLNRKEMIKVMSFDYRKLKGAIIEKYNSQSAFAKEIGISERTLSLKMNGKIAWRQPEIVQAIKALNLTTDDIQEYFFKEKAQNI